MDHPAIRVYEAGPYPVVFSSEVDEIEQEIQLDLALLIEGLPTIVASTAFPHDDTWDRIRVALESGDASLQVAPIQYEEETAVGLTETYPSAYIGLQCANGERLVLSHIRGLYPGHDAERYAQDVLESLRRGLTPDELGVTLDD
ncbi:MAG TPA: hypothetical protein VK928_00340 [Longimicrobiales bacterium]|nr:hypothetical protein [Longimicrobiales bacterium]